MTFARKHSKPQMKPTVDALDERTVPSPMSGMASLRALAGMRQAVRFNFNAGRGRAAALQAPRFAQLRLRAGLAGSAALNVTPSPSPLPPGGYYGIVDTPGGPFALNGGPGGDSADTSPAGATPSPLPSGGYYGITDTPGGPVGFNDAPAPAVNVSPPDSDQSAPFQPGGYYGIVDTPGGPVGFNSGFMAPRPGQIVPDAPPNGTLNA